MLKITRYYPYRITYDIETYMSKDHLPQSTQKLEFTAKHILFSVAVCSNVPGFTAPKCFITNGSNAELVKTFVSYISDISQKSYQLMLERCHDVITELDEFIAKRESIEAIYAEEKFSHPRVNGSRAPHKFKEKFLNYLLSIPVVGFNSQAYDLNVNKGPLLKHLYQTGKINYTIKRVNKLQCIETRELRFLDIVNFIAPGFSYDKYLKAFGCTQLKGFFPYDFITDVSKLD